MSLIALGMGMGMGISGGGGGDDGIPTTDCMLCDMVVIGFVRGGRVIMMAMEMGRGVVFPRSPIFLKFFWRRKEVEDVGTLIIIH